MDTIPDDDAPGAFTIEQIDSLWFEGGAAPAVQLEATLKVERPDDQAATVADDDGEPGDSTVMSSRRISMAGSSVLLRSNRMVQASGREKSGIPAMGDYEVGGKIGQGGMGIVLAAKQASLDRRVAVKMIRPGREVDSGAREKFILEALTTGSLEHPNIVPIYELGQDETGKLFYAMREVKGRNWRDALSERSEKENLEILCQIANAVASAHAKGILHRDIKTENVMLGDYGEVLLMDWGLAVGMRAGAKATPLGPANALAGTPAYMAPEMARGDTNAIGPWSDQYLLGAMLYEILTGRPPHTGADLSECLRNAANNVIEPSERSDEWMDVALRAMHGNPTRRYPSVKAFLKEVRNCQAHAESLELSRRAAEWAAMAKKNGDYDTYSRSLMGYEQALELWDGNESARRDGDQLRLEYAGAALQRADYDLSLSLLSRTESPEARAMAAKAATGKRERDSRRRLVKWLGMAAVILLLVTAVVAGGAAIIVARQAKAERLAREEAEEQRNLAESRRVEAEHQQERAEQALVETERQRNIAERERKTAEEQRNLAQTRRMEAERERERAEQALVETERQRAIAERERTIAEEQRGLAEAGRKEANLQRELAERRRHEAEAALATAEAARKAETEAMDARLREERARVAAEISARQAAEEALAARQVVQRMGYLEDNSRWRMTPEAAAALRDRSAKENQVSPTLEVALPGEDLSFAWIPAGEFVMGSPPREPLRSSEEHLHEVAVTRPFYIGRRELTRGQWRAVVGVESPQTVQARDSELEAMDWRFRPLEADEADLPATAISYRDVTELFLPALAKKVPAGYRVRLPSEAEWEWASRAGAASAFATGNGVADLDREGWFEENSGGKAHAVGGKAANAWGLSDCSGNAAEMVADRYDPNYYLTAPKDDPLCQLDTPMRVVRGGSFISTMRHCRLAARSYVHLDNRHPQVGVRLALEAK